MPASATRIEQVDPKGYQAKLQALLGDRDPLEVLAATPATLGEIVAARSAAEFQARPFSGKWTPNEILGHLLDAEWTFGYRVRTIACDERPTIVGMDQECWVTAQGHYERHPAELLLGFSMLRKLNLELWRRLTPAQLERVGIHQERGEESLRLMLRMEAGHDLSHIDQIQRYLTAIDEGRRNS